MEREKNISHIVQIIVVMGTDDMERGDEGDIALLPCNNSHLGTQPTHVLGAVHAERTQLTSP